MLPANKQPQAKRWCFTLNNPKEEDTIDSDLCDYMIVGDEVGDSGTRHFQGYVCFKKQCRLSALKKLLPLAHWEIAKGSPQQNKDYCSKDGLFQEFGLLPAAQLAAANGKRKADYDLAISLAKKQKLYEIDSGLLIRHMSSLKQIQRDFPPKLDDNSTLCGYWFVGKPGTGKSRAARWLFPDAYPKPCNKWWDGYQNQPYVLIDDFDQHHKVLGHHLKIWADHYPYMAEQKGNSIMIRPEIILITSNYSIEEIFYEDQNLQQAIKRRYTVIEF